MNISASSLSLGIANFQAQTLNSLFSSDSNDQSFMALLTGQLQNMNGSSSSDVLSALGGGVGDTSTTGRNMSLFDPESAYSMMSDINNREVNYKAQYSELTEMGKRLQDMENAGNSLGNISLTNSNDTIKSSLQGFVDQYNNWIQRFDEDLGKDGVLAGTQAAQVAQHELEQSVEYMYNGAMSGMNGLADLGISIDQRTDLASLDRSKLDSVLASNKAGVVNTVQEFSANFAKSADLLTSEGNFVPRQLNNLQHAISYISENIGSWKQEFGTGDAARPSRQVALALAAYNQNYAA